MELPILIIAWKRPEHLRQVIKSMTFLKPKNIYLACDGYNPNNKQEENLVKQTREIIESEINWPCKKKRLYSKYNLGCRLGVSRAISWFFENVSEGIILEDDCVPHPDFFKFCEILLNRFRDEKRIWTITASNYQDGNWRGNG